MGTNAYGVTGAEELAELRKVLQAMPGLGGAVIDTAQAYGASEEVIGRLLSDLGNRDKFFLATKTPLNGDVTGGKAVLDLSFRRLQVSKIDLLQIHNVYGLDELMPHYLDYKAAGKIRYIGVTTSVDRQYEQMKAALGRHKFDFMQIDYSIGDRGAADTLLPLAQEKGMAVLNNTPFGGRGRSYFPRVAGKPVPEWAKEFDATTWAQFFLKYNLSHPAITAAIPGTTTLAFLEDNHGGGTRPAAFAGRAQEDGRVLGLDAGLNLLEPECQQHIARPADQAAIAGVHEQHAAGDDRPRPIHAGAIALSRRSPSRSPCWCRRSTGCGRRRCE